ncbi:MAG: corrinoid protein [Candidatus Omnitrophica bacterium]|jgi:corrinoid protein of di/trimethylamine methyltransferase|nr:corrinoid protein [Candidatus Omnitrophota bacterium]
MSEEMVEKLAQAVIEGEPDDAEELAKQALDQGLDPLTCINEGLTKGIQRVGDLFASGEYYLPELIIGAEAMKRALAVLEPAMVGDQSREVVGTVVLGTVEGDMHEIGKTLVGTMLIANGFKVIDLGVDQSADRFIAAVKENEAEIVGASALLTTTMLQQKKIIEALEEAGLRDQVKVMVGGAPVTESFASEIGADGYAEDAISAVDLAFRLVDAPA